MVVSKKMESESTEEEEMEKGVETGVVVDNIDTIDE